MDLMNEPVFPPPLRRWHLLYMLRISKEETFEFHLYAKAEFKTLARRARSERHSVTSQSWIGTFSPFFAHLFPFLFLNVPEEPYFKPRGTVKVPCYPPGSENRGHTYIHSTWVLIKSRDRD